MMNNFEDKRHPVFRASSVLDSRKFEKEVESVRFTSAVTSNALLSFRINAATQLSDYGAVADWCDELAQQILVCHLQTL